MNMDMFNERHTSGHEKLGAHDVPSSTNWPRMQKEKRKRVRSSLLWLCVRVVVGYLGHTRVTICLSRPTSFFLFVSFVVLSVSAPPVSAHTNGAVMSDRACVLVYR